MKQFQIIPHTADIGLRVYGNTIKDLFENSASGLLHLAGLPSYGSSPKNNISSPLMGGDDWTPSTSVESRRRSVEGGGEVLNTCSGGQQKGRGESKSVKVKLHLSSPNPEELLIRWLNEILYYIQTKNIAVSKAAIVKIEGNNLTAELEGEVCNGGVKLNREIKAATYHNLEIKKVKTLLQAEIIFDI